MAYHSLVYGLNIKLSEQIPGIALDHSLEKTSPDLRVTFGSMPEWFNASKCIKAIWYVSPDQQPDQPPRLLVWRLPGAQHYLIEYADGTTFLLDEAGTRIWATWPSDTLTVEDTATYLLGPVMGFVLLLRGCISLHASAIAIDNTAVAIVGPAGAGKSTTAAALADLGYSVLAEDVVTLQDMGEEFLVQPAYPCIRLWPSSVRALYGEQAELPKLTPTWDKCYLDLTQEQYQFQTVALPLRAVYVLEDRIDDSSAPLIRESPAPESLISLIGNTYATYLMDKTMRAREFDLLGRVLKKVVVRKVFPHTDSARINKLCEAITTDFARVRSEQQSRESQDQSVHV